MRKYIFLAILYLMVYLFNFKTSFNFSFNSNSTSNSDLTFTYPTDYISISSEYGYRKLYGVDNFHNGIDFLAPEESVIYASRCGIVEYASFLSGGYGNTIIISHSDSIKSLYCHVSENFIVSVGTYVNSGDIIGYVGPKYLSNGLLNGNTTGPHLHFSIFKDNSTVNPLEYIKNRET